MGQLITCQRFLDVPEPPRAQQMAWRKEEKTQKMAGLLLFSFLIKLLLSVSFQKASVAYTTQTGWLDF